VRDDGYGGHQATAPAGASAWRAAIYWPFHGYPGNRPMCICPPVGDRRERHVSSLVCCSGCRPDRIAA
jgi:hypothetical protein